MLGVVFGMRVHVLYGGGGGHLLSGRWSEPHAILGLWERRHVSMCLHVCKCACMYASIRQGSYTYVNIKLFLNLSNVFQN